MEGFPDLTAAAIGRRRASIPAFPSREQKHKDAYLCPTMPHTQSFQHLPVLSQAGAHTVAYGLVGDDPNANYG